MDSIIALTLVLNLFSIFLNFKIDKFKYILIPLLMIKLIKEKRFKAIFLNIIILIIIIYNYSIAKKYFYLQIGTLVGWGCREYAFRLIEYIMLIVTFANIESLQKVYVFFKKYIYLTMTIVIISQVTILYTVVSRKGFLDRWGLSSFSSLYEAPHPYGYSLIVMVVIIEFLYIEIKKDSILILYFVPIFTSFLTGARTPMIAMVIMFVALRVFNREINVKYFISKRKVLLIIGGICVLIMCSPILLKFILNSSIVEKFRVTAEVGNFTNGRDEFWTTIIQAFNNDFSTKEKLLGHGIYYTIFINFMTIYQAIWAHSDYLDILVSYGAIMCIIYIILNTIYFIKINEIIKKKIYTVLVVIVFIILAFTNGIVNYDAFIPIISYVALVTYSANISNINSISED